jgi:hypothetical protein
MHIHQNLEQQIMEEQNKYMSLLISGKEFSALKSIKNNIKKMQRQLYLLQKDGTNHTGSTIS